MKRFLIATLLACLAVAPRAGPILSAETYPTGDAQPTSAAVSIIVPGLYKLVLSVSTLCTDPAACDSLTAAPLVVSVAAVTYGPVADRGQTDDPLTDRVSYAGEVYYVDCAGGDDGKDGRTPATAWKTLDKVNTKTWVGYWDTRPANASTIPPYHEPWTAAPSGSAFLLRRGTVCPGSLTVHAATFAGSVTTYSDNITFGAYGDRAQARPIVKYTAWTRARPMVFWTNGHRVAISNLAFIGNMAAGGGGLEVSNARGVQILNSTVEQAALDGVHADTCDDLRIENSTISGTAAAGGRGGGLTGSGSGWKVLQSKFKDNGRDKVGAHNIYVRHLHNAEIRGNSIEGGSNLGIVLHGSSDHVTIADNDIYGNSNGIDVTGGYSEFEVFDGITVENNLVRDNGYRLNEQGYGLLFKSMVNSTVRGNRVTGNRLGPAAIADRNPDDNETANVSYIGNTFQGAGALAFSGVAFSGMVLTSNLLSAPIRWGSTTPKSSFVVDGVMQ